MTQENIGKPMAVVFIEYKTETKLIDGKKDAQQAIVIPRNTLPNVLVGKEMSIHFWLYIRDWNYNFTKPKHIIHFGDKDANSTNKCTQLCTYPH